MERRAQLYESRRREVVQHQHKQSREYLALRNEHIEKVEQLGDEAASLYPDWEARDQLIFDLYTTSEKWRYGLSAQQTQQFIAKVQPMSEDELHEELRTAREAAERKAAIGKKIAETHRLNSNLTPEERGERYKKTEARRSRDRREYHRNYHKRRKEERKLQQEQRQPTQVFPEPTQE